MKMVQFTRWFYAVALLALLALSAWAGEVEPVGELVPVEYVRTIDGDTIVVRLDGEECKVRLIGIDAPELVVGTQAAFNAAARLAQMLEWADGPAVWLEYDDKEKRDKYGRELAWVWFTGGPDMDPPGELYLANLEMVREGCALRYASTRTRRYEVELYFAERGEGQ